VKTRAALNSERRREKEATEQRQLAEKSFEQAREAVDFLTATAINEFPRAPEFFQIKWRFLETSLAYYQSFLDQRRDDPALAAQLTAAESQVTSVLAELAAVDELLRTNFEIRLLAQPDVVKDLGLTPVQSTRAAALVTQVGSSPPAARTDSTEMTSAQIREAMSQEVTSRQASLNGILSPVQAKRLMEISRQIRGVFAFTDADLAAELLLTPSQKNAVRSACAEFHNRRHRGPKSHGDDGHRPLDDEGAGPPRDNFVSEQADMQGTVDRVLTQLTAHQIEAWQILTGQKYSGSAPRYESWFGSRRQDRGPDGGFHDHGPGSPDDPGADGAHDHGPDANDPGKNASHDPSHRSSPPPFKPDHKPGGEPPPA